MDARSQAGAGTQRRHRRLGLGWEPPLQLDRAGWLQAGTGLAEFGRVNNWWVGDWVRYGNARWGEKYVEAARITGLDSKTLRNIAYVASRFDLSRRRDNLTWTHHAEVAALPPQEQDAWLDRAIEQRFSPGDLRLELRSTQRALRAEQEPEHQRADGRDVFACPQCGAAIPLADIPRRPGPRSAQLAIASAGS